RAYYRDDPYDPRQTSMRGVTLNWFFYAVTGARRRLAERATEMRALKHQLGVTTRNVRALVPDPVDLERYGDGEELGPRLRRLRRFLLQGLPLKPNLAGWLTGVRDVRFPLAQYAGEVSYVDREVGRLRDGLRDLGVADRTVLVVTADPEEAENVAASHPEVTANLGSGLDAWMANHRTDGAVAEPPASIPPERLQQLRALGYVE